MDFSQPTNWEPLREHLSISSFRRYLERLQRHYEFISMDHAAKILVGDEPTIRNAMVVTFDDGYENNFSHALPVLQELSVPATFYVVTDLTSDDDVFLYDSVDFLLQKASKTGGKISIEDRAIDLSDRNPQELSRIYAELRRYLKYEHESEDLFIQELERIVADLSRQVGHTLKDARAEHDWSSIVSWDDLRTASVDPLVDIGSHTTTHRRLAYVTPAAQREELANSKAIIESELGISCRNFSFPNGAYDANSVTATQDAEYATAVITKFGLNAVGDDLFTLRRVFLANDLGSIELEAVVSGLSRDLGSVMSWLKRVFAKRTGAVG